MKRRAPLARENNGTREQIREVMPHACIGVTNIGFPETDELLLRNPSSFFE
jgi:hypothetical protein